MTRLNPISPGLLFNRVIGTGGIGSGIFFSLKGNETLGREESRLATLLPYKDFCKQHIIMHYIAVLLGAKPGEEFEAIPIGKVGNDETGISLVEQMKAVGMRTENIGISKDHTTLFSVCYQYPDHSGGNITTAESASNDITPETIDEFFDADKKNNGKEIILAAPEVPLKTRIRLLEHGRLRKSLNVASLLSAEIDEFRDLNGFQLTDMLFINLDEARRITGSDESFPDETIVLSTVKVLTELNSSLTVFITCGANGVYCYSNKHLEYFPSLIVEVAATAGAGDAFLAGTLAGITCGLPIFKYSKDSSELLSTATELGILTAAISVMSPDSIHPGINANYLHDFIVERNLPADDSFMQLF